MSKRVSTEEKKSAIIRIGFPEVFGEGSTKKNYVGKYCLMVMIPKNADAIGINVSKERKKEILADAKAFYKSLKSDLKDVATKAFGNDLDDDDVHWNDVIQDGDKKKSKKKKEPVAPGYFFFNTWTKNKPTIWKPRAKDGTIGEEEKDEFYSGVWARIFYNVYSYATDERDGATIGMGNIKKCYDDERLGGGGAEWDDEEDDVEDLEPDDEDFDGKKEEEDEDWD